MTTIIATYDGTVLVPDEPIDLQAGQKVSLRLSPWPSPPDQRSSPSVPQVERLSDLALSRNDDGGTPADLSAQVDQYLDGVAKRP